MAGLRDLLGLMSVLVLSVSSSPSSYASYSPSSSSSHASHSTFSSSLRNISLYPPCALDSDCSAEHACMQYMCYPWHTSTGFRWCSKEEDCQDLTEAEEGDGRDGLCFRHPDTQRIRFGICLKKIETKTCYSHGDCPRHLRCTNGYCGDRKYFEALRERQCEDDGVCERLLTGEMCCYDVSGAEHWRLGQAHWLRKCCNNPTGNPVLSPPTRLSDVERKKLDKGISYLAPMFLDYVICSGLSAELAAGLESCLPHTTTSTTDRTGRVSSVASRQGSGLLLLAVLLASEMFQSSPSSAQDI